MGGLIRMISDVGLIAEGGGMRGAYTAGVLEAFLDQELCFPYAIGVSAGANTLCSFLSKQHLRNKRLYTHWITDKRFIHWSNLLKEGAYFGMNFLFNDLPESLDPFDFDTFTQSKTTFKVGVTNCKTGECEYLEPTRSKTLQEADKILQASSSLPFISRMVTLDGTPYLDGGLADSIPIKKSIADGNERNVVILTRNADYRKTYSKKMHRLAKRSMYKYPKVADCIGMRYKNYNETLDYLAQLEKDNKVFILRPMIPLQVDRFEKNSDKLCALYEQGYTEAMNRLPELKKWLDSSNI